MINFKEKAKELFTKFSGNTVHFYSAKQCALISVNEIIELDVWNCFNKEILEYWQEVKKEIESI